MMVRMHTPDGQWIYFNSTRTGLMQIWKMRPDGTEQTQVTDDAFNNWFPHIAPDGKSMVVIVQRATSRPATTLSTSTFTCGTCRWTAATRR